MIRLRGAALATMMITSSAMMIHAQPVPIGSEFLVNTYTTYNQRRPAISAAPNGDFVIVWYGYLNFISPGQDGDAGGIFGQRYTSSGSLVGAEFQVNSYTSYHQNYPSVAVGTNGDFVVAWTSATMPMLNGGSIRARRFASDGTPFGPDFQVNTTVNFNTTAPAVAVSPVTSGFVVTWQYQVNPDILAQLYDSGGNAVGAEFQVNTYSYDGEALPRVEYDGNGDFVVVWIGGFGIGGQDGDYSGIFGQRFDSSGVRRGGEFQVNSYTTYIQYNPDISFAPNGDFVVSWTDRGGRDGDNDAIFAQRFSSAGAPLGDEFQVNSTTIDTQNGSHVDHHPNGDFVVVWHDRFYAIRGQRFGSNGTPIGAEFQANESTLQLLSHPVIAAWSDAFVVAWESNNQPAFDIDVKARRFGEAPTATVTATVTSSATVTATATPTATAGSGCAPTPLSGCFVPGKTVFLLRSDAADQGKDKLIWKWLKGDATTTADFGTPDSTTDHTLCVYDQGGQILEVNVPGGGTCGAAPCWKSAGSGYKYKDKSLGNDGVKLIKLSSGGAGSSKVKMKGQGANLPDPTLSLTLPVTVQLVNSIGECWSSSYTTDPPIKNDPTLFKAKEG